MAATSKKSSNNSKSLVSLIMFRYFPYWPLFILLIGVFFLGGWAYLRYYATPEYRSTATILVKDEKKGEGESKTLEDLNAARSKKIVENEIEVIRSKELLKEVVKNLSLYAPVYQEGHVKPVAAYSKSPIII